MLNLHATFTKGTVEFRLFQFDAPTAERKNGLHAGQLKSYIQLCLALSQMAKSVKTASPKPQQNDNPKYAIPAHAVVVEGQGIRQEALVAGHDVRQVAEGLGGVALGPDVDVDPTPAGVLAPPPGLHRRGVRHRP